MDSLPAPNTLLDSSMKTETIDRLENFANAYKQAPWRKQLQIIGLFSLALVVVAMIATVYLTVSARAAAVGRDIQSAQRQVTNLEREIEDLQAQLAAIRSYEQMEDRATKMGYQPLTTEQIVYLDIPGFTARQPAQLAPVSPKVLAAAPVTPPEFSESLFTWLRRQMDGSYDWLVGMKP
jgi:cell division protein FtsL